MVRMWALGCCLVWLAACAAGFSNPRLPPLDEPGSASGATGNAADAAAGQDAKPEVAAAQAAEAAENSANTAAAAARAAGNAASAADAAYRAAIAREKVPADFTVMPATISACDASGSFVIAGDHLARTPEKYLLGTVPASSFGGKGGGDAPSSDSAQSIEVDFKGLQSANRGLAEITLSMAATDGALRQKRISVEGSTATCTAAKSPSAPTTDGAPSGKGPAITFASPGKQPVDESDVCKLPLTLIATGTDAPKLTAASTSILGEAYVGNVQHDSSGKTTSTTVTFAKLPNFKDSMPSSHQMRIDVVLTGKKTGAITIPVTCGS